MPESLDLNDLYQQWLEIPADRLPPNHYALLGVDDFESDATAIEDAAKARNAYLHQIAAGPQRKIVQEMLGQVAVARRTLLSEEAKNEYDQALREEPAVVDEPPVHEVTEETPHLTPTESAQPVSTSVASPLNDSGKRSGGWTLHLISAGTLIVLVIAVYFYKQYRYDLANPNPVVAPQTTGSGIASGMDEKFSDVLSEIDEQRETGLPEIGERTSEKKKRKKNSSPKKNKKSE